MGYRDEDDDDLWFTESSPSDRSIKRVDLTTGIVSTVVAGRASAPTELVLDVANGFVYWTESDVGVGTGLFRATLAGTDIVKIADGLGAAFGLARVR